MALITLYETTAMTADGVVPLRFASGRGYNHPSAPGYYPPVIMADDDAPLISQSIFSGRRTFGFGERDAGVLTVNNTERSYDELLEYGYGRPARLLLVEQDAPYAEAVPLLLGTASGVVPELNALQLGWRDRSEELETPLQKATFAGSNSGTAGLEGLPGDIAGQPKPYASGRLLNHQPVLLNAPRRVIGWNFSPTGERLPSHRVDALRVNGALWQHMGNYQDAETLLSVNPTQGYYATCNAESMAVLGGSLPAALAGAVALDVTVEANPSHRQIAHQLKTLLLLAGVPAERISAADLIDVALACPYEVGVAVAGESAREALNAVMASGLVCSWVDATDTYRFAVMAPLDHLEPVATLKQLRLGVVQGPSDVDAKQLRGVLSGGERDVPLHEVRVRYGRNGLTLSSESVAAAVSPTDAAALVQEYRTTPPAKNEATLAKYPNAGALTHDTLLTRQEDAEAVRDALLTLLSQYRLTLEIEIEVSAQVPLALGDVIEARLPIYGMTNGRKGVIVGYTLDASTNNATLQVWMAASG